MSFYGYGDKKVETENSNRKKRVSVFLFIGIWFLVAYYIVYICIIYRKNAKDRDEGA